MGQGVAYQGFKQLHRLQGTASNYGLGPTLATSNGGVRYEVISVSGMQKGVVRIKTATNGGTLDVFFIGPDVDVAALKAGNIAYASIAGTIYTTGNATQGAVTAGTEQIVTFNCAGEDYAVVKFTGTVGAGTITYVDVATLGVGFGS